MKFNISWHNPSVRPLLKTYFLKNDDVKAFQFIFFNTLISSFIWNEKFFSWLNVKSYFRAKSFETNLSFKKKKKELFRAHKTILFSIILLLKRNSCRTNKHILFAFHKIKYAVFKKIYNCQFNINRGWLYFSTFCTTIMSMYISVWRRTQRNIFLHLIDMKFFYK